MTHPTRRTTDVIAGFLPLGGRRVLEVGCGEAVLLGWMRRRGADAIGLEREPKLLARARERLGPGGLVAGRGEALPLAAGTLDGLLYHNAFHHLPATAMVEALSEAGRVLRPGGRLLVLEPLAEGEYFALVRPLEDETAIRALARHVLARAGDLGLEPETELVYDQLVVRRSVEELLEALVAADPTRAARLSAARPAIEAAFGRLGEPGENGKSFRQPMLALGFARPVRPLELAVVRSAAERDAVFALRRAVFCVEQGVAVEEEFDGRDPEAEHLLARSDGAIVGTLRWRRLDPQGRVKLERVAVCADCRGKGIARGLLRFALARIDGLGLGPVVLHAQLAARAVYRGPGFLPEGEPFVEAGIPHQRMVRPLDPLAATIRSLL
ncbi:MAG: GNAT family N-acetyltransferase [Geminicoccaceae bacterium]|nr:GNAT family N-acetyltransferase [Geminicoccaceae bacterium]